METLLPQLCTYVESLRNAVATTTCAEDRNIYQQHLAASAEMFVATIRGDPVELHRLVECERRAYGLGFLSGEVGKAAESSFYEFAKVAGARAAA